MCGIVGYIGDKNASSVIMDGLRRLEYRGYDSSGIAVFDGKKIILKRSIGKLSALNSLLSKSPVIGNLGIGHTRWATHGKPSECNAHPHSDCTGNIIVVHNGIIENYLELKKNLIKKHKFKSETDTEVIAHTVEKYFKGDLLKAVKKTVSEIKGAFALGIMSSKDPGKIVAARRDTPLIIGLGEGENFIASDIPALLPYTRKMIIMEEDDIALVTKKTVKIFDKNLKAVKREIKNITWDTLQAEKSGYKHFMLKEIYEQPVVIQDTFRGRIFSEQNEILLNDIDMSAADVKKISKLYIIACGTSYHAGLIGKYLFESIAGIPVEVDIASEFRYRNPAIPKDSLTIIITQSGETLDTIAALRLAKSRGSKTIAICNVVGSTASRDADGVIYTHCGPEISVASTKAFTGQLTVLYILAFDWAYKLGAISKKELKNYLNGLKQIPRKVSQVLKKDKQIQMLAKAYHAKKDFLYLGRNVNFPSALEGALKLKEISYIHAEGYPGGEMKHGPIALIDENMPIMAIATQGSVYRKILGNIEEAKARGARIIALATDNDKEIKKLCNDVIFIPKVDELFSPILNIIPLQLFAYYVALYLGCDVDQPRNLAKSVTVE